MTESTIPSTRIILKPYELKRITLRAIGKRVYIGLPFLDNCLADRFKIDVTVVFERIALSLGYKIPNKLSRSSSL